MRKSFSIVFNGCDERRRTAVSHADRGSRRALAVVPILAAMMCAASASADTATLAPAPTTERWVATWSAAPIAAGMALENPTTFENQTLREIAHISVGGRRVRVRLSNTYGVAPLRIGDAHVAVQWDGPSIVPGTDRALTFNGSRTITIPTGAVVISDPVDLLVPSQTNLAVSVFVPDNTNGSTYSHAEQTVYVSPTGDYTNAAQLPVDHPITGKYFLTGIEVTTTDDSLPVVAAFGDSITEGFHSSLDGNKRWTDVLSDRLNLPIGKPRLGVANEGIGCSRLLWDFCGANGESRFDRDVIAVSGVTHTIVSLGLNDFGFPTVANIPDQVVSANDVIAGLRQLIRRAHAKGIKIIGTTITPTQGSGAAFPNYWTPENEAKRQAVNQWVRTGREFDGFIDFDAVLRDPNHPTYLLPAYDSGDGVHPNDAGYRAMGNAIDPNLFR